MIVIEPQDQSVSGGADAVFTVSATGCRQRYKPCYYDRTDQ